MSGTRAADDGCQHWNESWSGASRERCELTHAENGRHCPAGRRSTLLYLVVPRAAPADPLPPGPGPLRARRLSPPRERPLRQPLRRPRDNALLCVRVLRSACGLLSCSRPPSAFAAVWSARRGCHPAPCSRGTRGGTRSTWCANTVGPPPL